MDGSFFIFCPKYIIRFCATYRILLGIEKMCKVTDNVTNKTGIYSEEAFFQIFSEILLSALLWGTAHYRYIALSSCLFQSAASR